MRKNTGSIIKHSRMLQDIGELTTIVNSSILRSVMESRQAYLQKEANQFIRQQKWTEAYAAVAKMDDLNKTVEILTKQLEELREVNKRVA